MNKGKIIGLAFLELVLVGVIVFSIGFCSGRDYERANPKHVIIQEE